MDSMLKGLFGGDDDDSQRKQAQDFVGRYEDGDPWTGFTGEEAVDRYQQVSQHLSPEQFEESAAQAFDRMPPQQRSQFAELLQQQMGNQGPMAGMTGQRDDPRQLAKMTSQYQQQNPGGLTSLFGGGGGSGGGLGDMIGQVMGGGSSNRGGSNDRDGGGGLGDLLNNPMAKAALGGIAAMAFKSMMNRR